MYYAIINNDQNVIATGQDKNTLMQLLEPLQIIMEFENEEELNDYAYEIGCPWAEEPEDNDHY